MHKPFIGKTLLSFGIAALGLTTALQAQDENKTKTRYGMMTSFTSYHTDHDKYYNQFNPGAGFCVRPNFKFLEKTNATMDVEIGGYYNSIRSFTPFLAVTFNKKLGKSPFYLGVAAGLFGYQDIAADIIETKYKKLPEDNAVPEGKHSGAVLVENWVVEDQTPKGEYISRTIDRRARAKGPTKLYPIAMPRICADIIDNKNLTMGLALQGGYLPSKGGLLGLSAYMFF